MEIPNIYQRPTPQNVESVRWVKIPSSNMKIKITSSSSIKIKFSQNSAFAPFTREKRSIPVN
jgi:hypothetical protein